MQLLQVDAFRDAKNVAGIARIYQQAFGHHPWNEGSVCPVCETVLPLGTNEKHCPECRKSGQAVLLTEYWSRSKVLSDFYREMKRKGSLCVAVKERQNIVGFAWGYEVFVDTKLEQHLDAPNLTNLIQGKFFYLDECAISPNHQERGLGKMLVDYIFEQQKEEKILLRTLEDSRMFRLITNRGGTTVLRISRDRVIMTL